MLFYIDILVLLLKDVNISSTTARGQIFCPWPDIKKELSITTTLHATLH